MAKVLLKNNVRACVILAGVFTVPLIAGIALIVTQWGHSTGWSVLGWVLAAVSLFFLWRQLRWLGQPRLACDADALLVYLDGRSQPQRVPLDNVECFFLGQTATTWSDLKGDPVEGCSVVVRLAERDPQWHRGDAKPSLGRWCEGYITVRGIWCEPLNGDVVNRMNHDLAEIKRARKSK